MGSCFAESIGARLATNKVETLVNPFGTVFQPLALARLLRAAAGEEVDWQQHLVQARGRWQSYDLHGSIGADSPVDLLQHIQELVRRTGEFLRQADVVLLTLGTAWTYRLRETGELVNNCHKQPADLFVKELLTPDEIINGLAETHAYLRRINPNLRFVLTVSPVRHLKDTLPLNSVSKSVLRVATHIVSDLLPGVAYFPAYELLVDDLRDYRFYASDMLHPSEVAEDYIWDKFARTYFDVDFGRFRKEWASVRQSLGHRPLHEGAPEHRQFLVNTMEKLEQLSLRKVGVDAELSEVRAKIMALPVPKLPEPEAIPEDDEERIDIGDYAAPSATGEATAPLAPAADGRPPRLSPEEFRAQRAARSGRPERGRRDGHGKGQAQVPTENEHFQTSGVTTDDQAEGNSVIAPVLPIPAEVESTEQLLEQSATTTGLDATAGEQDPGKKRKRRSRGGAKRTARKNALRMAAGEIAPGDESDDLPEVTDDTAGLESASSGRDIQPEVKKSSVIAKSVPVKRGGRRNETNRVPRVALFAPPADAPFSDELAPTADAQAPVVETDMAPVEVAALIADAPVTEPTGTMPNPRNQRNRDRRNNAPASQPEAASSDVVLTAETLPRAVIVSAEELSGATASGDQRSNQPETQSQAFETAEQTDTTASEAPSTNEEATTAPAPARRSNRAKRAVSGARAEKPAVDTPVIPVPDALQLRTQVAAGRMMGSSATLIEPTSEPAAPAKTAKPKAAAPKKASAPKKAAPKAKATPLATPEPSPEPQAPEAPAKPAKKATAAKKTPTEAKAKPAPKPKANAAKAATPKPKAPRKPEKPA
ncbi:GSCFA domain-containing protein [Hymenobacter arizonensis]|nr:GSCFA domain-containing protein [Hymenobacter arizonensis]